MASIETKIPEINIVVPSPCPYSNSVVPFVPSETPRVVIFELTALDPTETLEVNYKIAKHIGIINELAPESSEFPFKVPILTSKRKYIDWVCRFIEFYLGGVDFMGERFLPKSVDVSKTDALMDELSIIEKCELLMEVNELRIPVMEQALAMYIGRYIHNLSPDVRRDTFRTSRALAPEELKAIRQENQWMENNDISERRRIKRGSIFTDMPPRRLVRKEMDCALSDGLSKLSFSMFALVIKMI